LLAVLLTFATILSARSGDGSTDAGSVISNRAEASILTRLAKLHDCFADCYRYGACGCDSIVTPDETASSKIVAPDHITRLFRVCNTGNTVYHFAHPVQCHGAGDPDRALFR
jgi:hypothetical protein